MTDTEFHSDEQRDAYLAALEREKAERERHQVTGIEEIDAEIARVAGGGETRERRGGQTRAAK